MVPGSSTVSSVAVEIVWLIPSTPRVYSREVQNPDACLSQLGIEALSDMREVSSHFQDVVEPHMLVPSGREGRSKILIVFHVTEPFVLQELLCCRSFSPVPFRTLLDEGTIDSRDFTLRNHFEQSNLIIWNDFE